MYVFSTCMENFCKLCDTSYKTKLKMAAKFELSPTLSKYLDRHLVFPLLEFLQVRCGV